MSSICYILDIQWKTRQLYLCLFWLGIHQSLPSVSVLSSELGED